MSDDAVQPDPTGLRHGMEEFLVSLVAERGLARNTIIAYRRDLTQYVEHLEADGSPSPSTSTIEAFLRALHDAGLAPRSIARKLAAVRGLHRFLVAESLADADPTALADSPRRPAPLPKALTIEEIERLLGVPDPNSPLGSRDRALLEFMYASGARVSETITVEPIDVDLEDRIVVVTGKGNKQRLVPIGRPAVDAITRYLPHRVELKGGKRDPGPLFLSARGRPLSRQAVWQIIRKHAASARIESGRVSPHVIRHSTATHLVEGGADLRTVQEILGHASISTTQVYTRVSPRHLFEVYVTSHPRSR